MNYETARQRSSDGRWDWTNHRDGQTYAVEPCTGHEDGHETADLAARHRWEWESENARDTMETGAQHPCAVCKEWTQGALVDAGGMGWTTLCDAHRNPAGWRAAHPFTGNWQSTHS